MEDPVVAIDDTTELRWQVVTEVTADGNAVGLVITGDVTNTKMRLLQLLNNVTYVPCDWLVVDNLCIMTGCNAVAIPLAANSRNCSFISLNWDSSQAF